MTDQEHIDHLDHLLSRYIAGQSTAADTTELFDWIREEPDPELIRARMQEFWDHYQETEGDGADADFERIFAAIQKAMPAQRRAPVRISRPWLRTAAAILMLILAGTSAWLLLRSRNHQEPVAQTIRHQDISAPSGAHAILTLSNGQKIILDSAKDGILAQQGSTNINKLNNGELAYLQGEEKEGRITYNTLTNPRGSQVISLKLADGTKVWLNAASSLHYPTAFTGKTRQVEVSGEAYFEVAENAKMPFIVKKENTAIAVLGTSFNINSYDDEPAIKITLVEGAVKISHDQASVLLKPGQQARVSGDIQIGKDVDLDAVMAWKNGLFAFHNADLPAVMRQLARWYNIDVSYEGYIPQEKFQFNGKMGKDLMLSEVLDLLTNAQVHFAILTGNKLVIRP